MVRQPADDIYSDDGSCRTVRERERERGHSRQKVNTFSVTASFREECAQGDNSNSCGLYLEPKDGKRTLRLLNMNVPCPWHNRDPESAASY